MSFLDHCKAVLIYLTVAVFLSPSGLHAASTISVAIDSEFIVEGHGLAGTVEGKKFYNVVTLHKFVQYKGSTYYCLGYVAGQRPPMRAFFAQSRVISPDGTVVVRGAPPRTADLAGAPALAPERRKSKIGLYFLFYPTDKRLYRGERVTCKRLDANVAEPVIGGNTRLVFPKSVTTFKTYTY